MVEIQTERLKLRAIQLSDLNDYADLLGDPVVTLLIGGPRTREFMAEKIVKDVATWPEYGYGRFMLELQADQPAIGMCGVWRSSIDDFHFDEVGYAIFEKYWGLGLTTEAVRAVVQFARDKAKLRKLYALVDPKNQSSKNVLTKCGFTFQRTVERQNFKNLELWLNP